MKDFLGICGGDLWCSFERGGGWEGVMLEGVKGFWGELMGVGDVVGMVVLGGCGGCGGGFRVLGSCEICGFLLGINFLEDLCFRRSQPS
ncbi:unnamed protein product [Moneuplotes crassus]|uniref:Uncharacterized protein n=1 Tax=Euplotes crassus TaxID=5936 RepID=A0AAD1U400_EUPCR|nr:unnamed protein product [Moneuplotes crassus]